MFNSRLFRLGPHRVLCFFGVHHKQEIFSGPVLDLDDDTPYTDSEADFTTVGYLCGVCYKHWEKD